MSQTSKKIVSKGEYAKALGQGVLISIIGMAFIVATAVCGITTLLFTGFFVASLAHIREYGAVEGILAVLVGLAMIIVLGIGTVLLGKLSVSAMKTASDIGPIAPLTRANTVDLPADETLVRASEQPITMQQDVLLRPTVETQDVHEEQLLRPS